MRCSPLQHGTRRLAATPAVVPDCAVVCQATALRDPLIFPILGGMVAGGSKVLNWASASRSWFLEKP